MAKKTKAQIIASIAKRRNVSQAIARRVIDEFLRLSQSPAKAAAQKKRKAKRRPRLPGDAYEIEAPSDDEYDYDGGEATGVSGDPNDPKP